MTRNFSPIEFEASELGPEHSEEIYKQLKADISGSKHGNRFEIRDFTLERHLGVPSPMDIDIPYLPPTESTNEHREWLAKKASSLLMPGEDWSALQEGFKKVYERNDVSKHLAGGGILKVIDSHRTYTGQVIQQIASWSVLKDSGVVDPHELQTTIASRTTTLFKLSFFAELLKDIEHNHREGAIIEDLLLQFGGVLLTIPNSQSGNRLVQTLQDGLQTRRAIVARTKLAHEQLVNRGGSDGQIFLEGPSGAENQYIPQKGVIMIGEVKERTAKLTTDYNQTEDAERIMTLPIFMESNPYTNNPSFPILPTPTPFAILEPRFPKNQRDFDEMMTELAVAGTIVKSSGEAPYRYEKFLVGRRRRNIANIIFKYTV